jgi:site-specific DNA-methyltransferase (adenine-specific)
MNFKILQGDNKLTLKNLPDNSVDSIVTDPPYGIDFLGKDWDANTGALETYQECLRVLKPGGHILAFSAARTYHHLAITLEQAGFEIRDQIMWLYSSGFPKSQDVGKSIERSESKRKSISSGTIWHNHNETDIKKTNYCTQCNKHVTMGIGFNCDQEQCNIKDSKKPADNEWAGWGNALKPAHEPICMGRKPMKQSIANNVQEWGTGAINIDACRVGDEQRTVPVPSTDDKVDNTMFKLNSKIHHTREATTLGRFPTNVIGEVEDYQKYFYCPKVSRKERHIGFDELPAVYDRRHEGLVSAGIQGLMKLNGEKKTDGGNNHPTVKPVELMKYLIKLVTPKDGIVLDPFTGSGSTGMACVELGHEFIGCELDPEYVKIAETRIAAWYEYKNPTTFNDLFEEE